MTGLPPAGRPDCPSGFSAFGHSVPVQRQVAALDTAVEHIGIDPMLADPVIRNAARYIELDKPDNALIALQNITDLTGAYRLLAVLCTEPVVRIPAPGGREKLAQP